jgi:SAM-dependent methyltransferase
MNGSPPGDGVFSCVVDDHPRFHLDALRWFTSLTDLVGIEPDRMVVHAVGGTTSEALTYLQGCGVAVRTVEPFDQRSSHCNKIAGAARLAEEHRGGTVVLCDADVVFFNDPRGVPVPQNALAAKPVDAPLPPLDILTGVFMAAGLEIPAVVNLPWGDGERSLAGNANGGLYLMQGATLPTVVEAWTTWARWLLDRIQLLDRWSVHVDQVSMALALVAADLPFQPLDVRWNTPSHDPSRTRPDADLPAVIHYHQAVDSTGRLLPTGSPAIDTRIDLMNRALAERFPKGLPAALMERWRHQRPAPEVQPGDGELGTKITTLVDVLGASTVCELGPSVDTRSLALPGHTVVDGVVDRPADITLCLDTLPFEPDPAVYQQLIEQLWRSTGRGMVVRGLESEPDSAGTGRVFHEPLSRTLRAVTGGAECYPIDTDGPLHTVAVLRAPAVRHPRDYGPETLGPLLDRHPDPFRLAAIRADAWRTVGFYPDHAPRLWEYPVVVGLVEGSLAPGSRVVDVGAGTTPIAPYLTGRGFLVDTVDPSPRRRSWPPAPDWNEWDFLDYGSVGLARRSWNTTLDRLPPRPLFDGAYSVSVIEHIPADDRRSLLADLADRVRPGGLVVLTIDLVRDTDDLWNRNLGVTVEDLLVHGTFAGIVEECEAVGLELVRRESVRDWGATEVDIGLLVAKRTGTDRPRRTATVGHRITSLARRLRG